MSKDADHLQILAIFYYAVAVIAALFSLIPTVHLVVGIALASGAFHDPQPDFPFAFVGWFFILFASFWIAFGLAFSACIALAGRSLQRRRRYTFCLIMGCVACMFMPFGTVLGVFTIILLLKEEVKAQFEAAGAGGTPPPDHFTPPGPTTGQRT